MRREYNINPDEWKLIFDAPLTSDFVERVHNVMGTSNANIHTFDANRGLHVKTTSAGQYGVKYVMPQSFSDAISTNGQLRLLNTCIITKVSGGNSQPVPFRMDNTSSDTNTSNAVIVSQISSIAFNSSYLNLPKNTPISLWEELVYDYTNLSSIPMSSTVHSDYDSRVMTRTFNTTSRYLPQQCPYVRLIHAINNGALNECYIKDLKVYRYTGGKAIDSLSTSWSSYNG